MNLTVAISTVSDGSMLNRNDVFDPEVIKNREAYLEAHSITLEQSTRVRVNYDRDNFCRYITVDELYKGQGMRGDDVVIADALITTRPEHALFLPIADCVGAAIYDPIQHIVAVAHFGRHSLEQSGAHKIISHLKEKYGSNPKDIQIWLTPAPGKDVYPIWALDNKGMKEVTFEQLKSAGILLENIIDNPTETDKDPAYYSYSEFLKGHRANDGDYAIVAMLTNESAAK